MALQRTLAIIKPDAVAAGNIGVIINEIEKNGFQIVALKMLHLTTSQAEGFYAVHRERPFFGSLVEFMTEGPVVTMILQKENAIVEWRNLMGATDPDKADEGTIRKKYGASLQNNATHGSDAEDTAAFETRYFFNAMEIV
jgi:nucleoside-diphosphate kinase